MFKVVCFLIPLICLANSACPSEYFEVYDQCFRLITVLPVNWTTAEDVCEDDGGHLAFVKDCNALTELSNQIDLLAPTSYVIWIGATDSEEEGVWKWLDGTDVPMGSPFWGSSPPGWIPEPSGGSNADCAHVDWYDQYHFHDEDCTRLGDPLCEVDPLPDNETSLALQDYDEDYNEEWLEEGLLDGECPEGFVQVEGFCFYFYYFPESENITTSWDNAQTVCSEVYPGAYLAILTSCEVFRSLVELINSNETYQVPDYSGYWVSANDIASEGHWVWGDNSDVRMGCPFWGNGDNWLTEPGGGYEQNCGIMLQYDRYYFHDGECYLEAYALCQVNSTLTG